MIKWKRMIQAGNRLPLFMDLMMNGLSESLRQEIGWGHRNCIVKSESGMISWYVAEEDIDEHRMFLQRKLLIDKDFVQRTNRRIVELFSELVYFCADFQYIKFKDKTNDELIYYLEEFTDRFQKALGMYSFPAFTEKVITQLLKNGIQELNPELDNLLLQEYLQVLALPLKLSDYKHEHHDFLRIVTLIQGKGLGDVFKNPVEEIKDQLLRYYPNIDKELDDHVEKFCYLQVHHAYNPPTKDHLIQHLKEGMPKDWSSTLKEAEDYLEQTRKAKEGILSKIQVHEEICHYIAYLEELSYINDVRKLGHSQAHYLSHPLFKEIARRLNLSHVEVKYLLLPEVLEALQGEKVNVELIKERMKFHVLHIGKKLLTGEKAKYFIDQEIPRENKEIKEFKGQVASPGMAKGRVKLILKDHEISKVEEGDILVTSMTNPDMVLGMQKAAAIVTNEGGLLCHAAIISRELKKPCVIGTGIATDVLVDGELVEVDAMRGVVRKIIGEKNEN